MIPDAAAAVIAAAIEDAARHGNTPQQAATRAVRDLERAGWTITVRQPQHAPQRAA
jgi:hypothetical protein